MRASWLILLGILTVALPCQAQVYEWRDAQGRPNYSDRPPPGVDAHVIRSRSASEAEPPPPPATWEEREAGFRERRAQSQQARTQADTDQAREAERQRLCEQATSQLANLESSRPLARLNERGEQEILDGAARAEETAKTRAFIAQNCP
ncbi:DUF4124 domain-containing protein [Rhodocyclaceae bacterium SMB388]